MDEISVLTGGFAAGLALAGMGRNSQWNVKTAIDIMQQEGVSGQLVFRLPATRRERIEVDLMVVSQRRRSDD